MLTNMTNDKEAQRAVLMYRVEKDSLHIVETTLNDKELHEILPELLLHTGTTWAFERNMGGDDTTARTYFRLGL